jgi:hypothetical protein
MLVGSILLGLALISGTKTSIQSDSFPDIPDNHWAYETPQYDNYPDIPDNHWFYEMYDRAKKPGLVPEDKRSMFYTGRPYSRYELAAFVHGMTMHLDHEVNSKAFKIELRKNEPKALTRAKALEDVAQRLPRADRELAKEFRGLGVNFHKLIREANTVDRKLNRYIKTLS